ncbi:MAG: hypothetical protein MZW92_54235 [Comamonadaceae bacterium]|nr:hypothetical protein [Comamonadaceae bacterium]
MQLFAAPDEVTLEIADDGVGFDPQMLEATPGFGLQEPGRARARPGRLGRDRRRPRPRRDRDVLHPARGRRRQRRTRGAGARRAHRLDRLTFAAEPHRCPSTPSSSTTTPSSGAASCRSWPSTRR